MDLAVLEQDSGKQSAGVTVPLVGDAEVTIRSLNSPDVQAAHTELLRRHAAAFRARGLMAISANREVESRLLADHLVVGWKNVSLRGKEYPYSRENVYELCMKLDQFRAMLWEQAASVDLFRLTEDELGN